MTNYWDPQFLKHLKTENIKYVCEVGARYGDESIYLSKLFKNAKIVKSILLDGKEGTYVQVVGNFGVGSISNIVTFPITGTWTDQIDNSTINVNELNYSITLAPGEYHVYSNRNLIK